MNLKRFLALFLACLMVFSLVACGNNDVAEEAPESNESTPAQEDAAPEAAPVEDTGITFPLEKTVEFDILVSRGELDDDAEKIQLLKDLEEQTNVKINWVEIEHSDNMTVLNAMFTANKEPDAIFANFISDADASAMANNGLLMPLNEYITEDIMPNYTSRVVAECPDIMGVTTMPNGNIYVMPRYSANPGSYLESPFWINKNWVEQAGWKVEDIKTIDDLETVLTYFKENDMNGNGDAADEIPYMIFSANSANHVEAFLGLYGIATKNSTYENYVTVKDGQVVFAPTTQAWKDAISKLADWYAKGLIWEELYTAAGETYTAKFSEVADPVIGLWNKTSAPAVNPEEYVQIAPVSVEGYETEWYIHPGIKGTKGGFAVTRSCENVDILMAWIDQFYSFENSIRSMYGEEADGRWGYNAEGKVEFYTLDPQVQEDLMENTPSFKDYLDSANPPSALTQADYAERLALSEADAKKNESYALYKDYLTDESWPRPYFDGDATTRLGELRTDIFSTLSLKMAEWITGVSDIDAEYDAFVADLEKMGIDEFITIMQTTYDNYMSGIK